MNRQLLYARSGRADARRNREKVLEAGRAVFAADGPDAQMADIAARAGVGVGTVYRHFPTKATLAAELVAECLDHFAQQGREALAAQASPWDALADTLRRNLESLEHDAGTRHAVTRAGGIERLPGGALGLPGDAVDLARFRLHEVYSQLVAAAQAERTLRTDFGAEDLDMVMRAMCASIQTGGDWRRHLTYILDGLRAHHRDVTVKSRGPVDAVRGV